MAFTPPPLRRRALHSLALIRQGLLARRDAPSDPRALPPFAPRPDLSAPEYFEELFLWLLRGFLAWRGRAKSRVYYPGQPARSGALMDGLMGFARFLPLLAAWVRSGREPRPRLDGREIDLVGVAADGFIAGTDPGHDGYWGLLGRAPQGLVEAHDLALSFWLLRDPLSERLSGDQRRRAADWLGRAPTCPHPANNWALFPAVVELCLEDSFPDRCGAKSASAKLETIKSLHAGDGWFRDGADGPADYYNAWAFHYSFIRWHGCAGSGPPSSTRSSRPRWALFSPACPTSSGPKASRPWDGA